MDIVVHCSSNPPAHLRSYMNTMSELDNIPRNEKKFVNFASNSLQLRGSNIKIVEEIWNLLKLEQGKRIAAKEVIKDPEFIPESITAMSKYFFGARLNSKGGQIWTQVCILHN